MINTKWQYDCIKALATSPLAFYTFKLKQKNKKVLSQYISRIWPSKRVNLYSYYSFEEIKNFKNNPKTITQLIDIYQNITEQITLEMYVRTKKIKIEPLILEMPLQTFCDRVTDFKRKKSFITANFFKMNIIVKRKDTNRNIIDAYVNEYNITRAIYDTIIYHNDRFKSKEDTKVIVQLYFYSTYCTRMSKKRKQDFSKFIETLYIFINTKRKKQSIQSLNVGIEIEHDAKKPTPVNIKRHILRNGCREYDSGFDAGASDRLRENRIRLGGVNGLNGLYILLQDMLENAAIAKNSSVHMHIDCLFDNKYFKVCKTSVKDKLSNDIIKNNKKNKFEKAFNKILDLKKDFNLPWLIYDSSKMRYHDDFYTIEYRVCRINFSYTDYVIQILAWIHLTQALKWKFGINLQYLEMLAKIQSDINKIA